jgi:hypothetical protein
MAPNKRGGPQRGTDCSVLSAEEIAARGSGTAEEEGTDSYDGSLAAEVRVFFTGALVCWLGVGVPVAISRPLAFAVSPRRLLPALPLLQLCCDQLPPRHHPPKGLMFLTRLPVPPGTDHHPTYLMRSTMVGRAPFCAPTSALRSCGSRPQRVPLHTAAVPAVGLAVEAFAATHRADVGPVW